MKYYNDLVSIVMPAYNSSRFISEAIESVLAQTYLMWEMIIVDDGSTDETYDIAKEFAKRDERIKVVRLNQNSGPAIARNVAIKLSKGRYIAFLDSDDMWLPSKLEIQMKFMKRKTCVLSFTSYIKIKFKKNKITSEKIIKVPSKVDYKQLLKTNVIGCSTAMYDSKILGKIYMPNISKRQDYALWLRILKMGFEAFGINQALTLYRSIEGSVSSNKLKAAFFQWKVYRSLENLSFKESLYYFVHYIWNGIKKYV